MRVSTRSPLAEVASYPAEFVAKYRAAGYWTDETFDQFVLDRTHRFADRLAVVGVDAHGSPTRWTYAALADAAESAAGRLAEAGVGRGDRVVLALPNVVEFVAVVLGCFRIGVIPIFAQPGHREVELTQFCVVADVAAIITCGDLDGHDHASLVARVGVMVADRGVEPPVLVDVQQLQLIERERSERSRSGGVSTSSPRQLIERERSEQSRSGEDPYGLDSGRVSTSSTNDEGGVSMGSTTDVALLQLSGGTTGVGKLIPRTHADYLYSVRASAEICRLTADDRLLVVLPAAHNFAMSSPGILGVLHVGGAVVLARDPSPRTSFRLIQEEGVTWTSLVPPLAQAWIASATRRSPDLTSLQTIQVGGAKLADEVASQIGPVLGARVQQVFGMAEGLVNYTRLDDPEHLVLSTQGRPISDDDEIRIVDPDDPTDPLVAEGVEGELLTRGPYTIRGYYEPTGPTGSPGFTADGFYRTGDLVRQLPTGHLVVTGRAKDQINRGGEKVATEEIERPLLARPDVRDAVALGLPDAYLGERICVVVRPEDGATPGADLASRLLDHLKDAGVAAWKLPDQFEFVDELPVTHVGKNSRRDLRAALVARLRADQSPETQIREAVS